MHRTSLNSCYTKTSVLIEALISSQHNVGATSEVLRNVTKTTLVMLRNPTHHQHHKPGRGSLPADPSRPLQEGRCWTCIYCQYLADPGGGTGGKTLLGPPDQNPGSVLDCRFAALRSTTPHNTVCILICALLKTLLVVRGHKPGTGSLPADPDSFQGHRRKLRDAAGLQPCGPPHHTWE